ncbi:hypothetical protein [Lysobacter gummosus]|uniref:hypothetical protein n=1 Tax=Lysobacter gummosus TaxID=262324 RepID=UPI00364521BB
MDNRGVVRKRSALSPAAFVVKLLRCLRARAIAEIYAGAFAPAALIPSPQPSPASGRGSPNSAVVS